MNSLDKFDYYFVPFNIQFNIQSNITNIHFVTICSDESKLKYLIESANGKIKINYIVVKWNGFIDKIIKMIDFINTIPDEDIICFIDAYDIIVSNDTNTILNKFIDYNCDILFSSELVCFPKMNETKYDALNYETNYKYLNSGGYIGYKKNMHQMLTFKSIQEISKICEIGGDQNYFTQYYLENIHLNIKLDVNQKIFQSMCCVNFEEFEFRNGYLYNILLDTYPSFIHFNGFGDDDIKTCIDTDTNENVDVLSVFFEKQKKSENGNLIKLFYKQFDNKYIKQK